MSNKTTPVLFIGHGSPMNAIDDNKYTQFLNNLSKTIEPPKAIIVFSAHWLTEGTFITSSEKPKQIYDFYGFPDELYKVKYEADGLPEIANQIVNDNFGVQTDVNRGIDHAAWAVIKHIYPKQNIPVLEISLDVNKSLEEHYNFAKQFNKYRSENILFIGSGNIIHNLRNISWETNAEPAEWAAEMDNWFAEQIKNLNIDNLLHYTKVLKDYRMGIPTTEHYIPLLYVLGMKQADENVKTVHESIQNGTISMRSIEIS